MTDQREPRAALTKEALEKALRRAFQLGQTYWQQADSEYTSQHRKVENTLATYEALINETLPLIGSAPFQPRVQPWMLECFGAEIAADGAERNHRFLEESLELVQSCGCTRSEAHQLVDYVFSRPVGQKDQEVGGVMVTLAALCLAQSLDMHAAGDTELARVWTKVEQIRAKQAAKPKHSPLPQHTSPHYVTVPRLATDAMKAAPAADRPGFSPVVAGEIFHAMVTAYLREQVSAENTAAISADHAEISQRAEIIARAVAAHDGSWPEQLTSGVMFYEGERITKAEFKAEVRN